MSTVFRLPLLLLSFFFCPVFVSGSEVLEYLRGYEGRWVGQFTIHSTANGFTENFPVEQRYWWEDETLHGLAVSQRDNGLVTATSIIFLDGDALVSEVKRGDEKEVFRGVLHDDGIVWLPADLGRATDHQIRELLVDVAGGAEKLMTEGFDTYVYADGLAHIIYRGELVRQPE